MCRHLAHCCPASTIPGSTMPATNGRTQRSKFRGKAIIYTENGCLQSSASLRRTNCPKLGPEKKTCAISSDLTFTDGAQQQHVLSLAFSPPLLFPSPSWTKHSRSSGMAELEEEDPFTLRAYIQTLTRISKPHFEEKGSKIEDWVRQRTDVDHKTQF